MQFLLIAISISIKENHAFTWNIFCLSFFFAIHDKLYENTLKHGEKLS